MPPQRKHLQLQEKVEILEDLKKGIGATFLSRKYGVAKSTISSIKNKRKQILKTVDNTFTGPGKRKTLKLAVYPKMEKALYKWFLKQKSQHEPVDREMIKEKAKNLHVKFYPTSSFNASNGWLQKFKTRYGIRYLKISKKLSSQPELMSPFKEKLLHKIKELQLISQAYETNEFETWDNDIPPKNEEDEEIIQTHNADDTLIKDSDVTNDKLISCTDALESLNTVLQWTEENADEIEISNILVLQILRSKLVQKCQNVKTTN